MKFIVVLVCVVFIAKTNAARILFYIPTPSISHQLPFRPLSQELARRGHDVVVITTDPAFAKGKSPANLTEVDVHGISYKVRKVIVRKNFQLPILYGNKNEFIKFMQTVMFPFRNDVIDEQLSNKEIKQVISDGNFDLLLLESFKRPILGLSHLIKVPVIQMSSYGSFIENKPAIGAPSHPIHYPVDLRQKLYNLTFWEKLNEMYNHYKIAYVSYKWEKIEHEMLQKHFGMDMPTINELRNNIDMLFLNTHPVFEGNHPVPPSVVYIWGIHKIPQKELPNEIKTYLDSSEHGVIYMSFGTNTDPTILPQKIIQMFVKVFCQLPYDVLWKWNKDELPGRCKNIRIAKWFPQSDLLRHPNIKVFITQGGLQSTDEAISAGVPMVGIPMVADQWYNVEKYSFFRIGVRLDLETLSEEIIKNAVTSVILNESYRNNVKKLDALLRDEPAPALQRAVWWVEHVLRHGGARHLRAPAANISWAQYLELELVAILLAACLITAFLIIILLKYFFRFIKRIYLTIIKGKIN